MGGFTKRRGQCDLSRTVIRKANEDGIGQESNYENIDYQ